MQISTQSCPGCNKLANHFPGVSRVNFALVKFLSYSGVHAGLTVSCNDASCISRVWLVGAEVEYPAQCTASWLSSRWHRCAMIGTSVQLVNLLQTHTTSYNFQRAWIVQHSLNIVNLRSRLRNFEISTQISNWQIVRRNCANFPKDRNIIIIHIFVHRPFIFIFIFTGNIHSSCQHLQSKQEGVGLHWRDVSS